MDEQYRDKFLEIEEGIFRVYMHAIELRYHELPAEKRAELRDGLSELVKKAFGNIEFKKIIQ